MSRIIPVEIGQEVILMRDNIQLVKKGVAVTEVQSRQVAGGDNGDGGEVNRNILGSLAVGLVDTAVEIGLGYPQSAWAAVKYRFLAEIGIRPPTSEYAPVVSRQQRKIVRTDALNQANIVVDMQYPIVQHGPKITGKEKREKTKMKKNVMAELEQQRLKQLADASDYYSSVLNIVGESKQKRQNAQGLYDKAVGVMRDQIDLLTEAFVAGQAVSGDPGKSITELERAVAGECVMAERRYGGWTAVQRKEWVMKKLTSMAKSAIVETGAKLVEREELDHLNKLNVSGDNVEDIEDGDKVLLHIPPLDIAFATQLGADHATKGMAFGVTVVLAHGNKIKVKYLAKKETVAASPATLDTDVGVVRGAALVGEVQNGDFGGRTWRRIINKILGDEQARLPLVGNLVLSSLNKTATPVVIPMLNPAMGDKILTEVKGALQIIESRTSQIEEDNEYIGFAEEALSTVTVRETASRIQSLPNATKITTLAGRSVGRIDGDLAGTKVVTEIELEKQKSTNSQNVDMKLKSLAEMVITSPKEAREYLRERSKRVDQIMRRNPPKGDSNAQADSYRERAQYIRAFDSRAEELLQKEISKVPVGRVRVIDESIFPELKKMRGTS